MVRIGYMQGRLSPMIEGRIQAFPWPYWREEFPRAQQLGFALMEWTIDQERLHDNPLLTSEGRDEIRKLCVAHSIIISSLTGDCFMESPLWKAKGEERKALERDFLLIIESAMKMGIGMVIVPLVDNGRLNNLYQEDNLVNYLHSKVDFLKHCGVKLLFESDYPPPELVRFIDRLDPDIFGVNYDVGNSAALGYNPEEEITAYGHRIRNVHVKDRTLGGGTVPLGTGAACFETVFAALAKADYTGNYILQTARAVNGDHLRVLGHYRDMTLDWIIRYAP